MSLEPIPPQGEQFEDQYTSATADLSAGGVATRHEAEAEATAAAPQTAETPQATPYGTAGEPWSSPTTAREGAQPAGTESHEATWQSNWAGAQAGRGQPGTLGMGAGALLALGGVGAGAWLLIRRQQERNKPINRFRRSAREVASKLGERWPVDAEDLPEQTGQMGGAAAAAFVAGLLLGRGLRPAYDPKAETLKLAVETARKQSRSLPPMDLARARELARGMDLAQVQKLAELMDLARVQKLAERLPRSDEARQASRKAIERARTRADAARKSGQTPMMGLGFGGMAMVAAATYLIWRLLRGAPATPAMERLGGE